MSFVQAALGAGSILLGLVVLGLCILGPVILVVRYAIEKRRER